MDTGTTVYYSQDNYTAGEYSHPSKVKDRLYDERRLQQPEDSQPSRLHTISHTPTVTPVPTLPAAPPPAVATDYQGDWFDRPAKVTKPETSVLVQEPPVQSYSQPVQYDPSYTDPKWFQSNLQQGDSPNYDPRGSKF